MAYTDDVRDALAKDLIGLHPELLDFYTLLAYVDAIKAVAAKVLKDDDVPRETSTARKEAAP